MPFLLLLIVLLGVGCGAKTDREPFNFYSVQSSSTEEITYFTTTTTFDEVFPQFKFSNEKMTGLYSSKPNSVVFACNGEAVKTFMANELRELADEIEEVKWDGRKLDPKTNGCRIPDADKMTIIEQLKYEKEHCTSTLSIP